MGYGNTDSGGIKVIVIALAVLVIVAFIIGGILVGNLQGFIPGMIEQRVNEWKITNAKSEEELRHIQAQNAQAEKNAADSATQQKEWNAMILVVIQEVGMQTASALSWALIIVACAFAVRFVLPSLQIIHINSAPQMVPLQNASALPPPEDSDKVLGRPQTPSEKEVHRFARELARQRERRERTLAARAWSGDSSNGNRRAA